jgi:hypothetical protein
VKKLDSWVGPPQLEFQKFGLYLVFDDCKENVTLEISELKQKKLERLVSTTLSPKLCLLFEDEIRCPNSFPGGVISETANFFEKNGFSTTTNGGSVRVGFNKNDWVKAKTVYERFENCSFKTVRADSVTQKYVVKHFECCFAGKSRAKNSNEPRAQSCKFKFSVYFDKNSDKGFFDASKKQHDCSVKSVDFRNSRRGLLTSIKELIGSHVITQKPPQFIRNSVQLYCEANNLTEWIPRPDQLYNFISRERIRLNLPPVPSVKNNSLKQRNAKRRKINKENGQFNSSSDSGSDNDFLNGMATGIKNLNEFNM